MRKATCRADSIA